jgi:HK97 family phage major capsid protein
MKKTLHIPNGPLFRAATIALEGEGESQKFRMSISSDTPYKRYDWWADEEYYEVLDHGPGGMDDTRLKAGLPILFNHDRNQHLGRATSFSNDGKKCDVENIIWSGSEFAQQKKKDAESGALPDTSVGYQIEDEGECIGAKDGIPIYKFRWAPYEGSIVTIPADITVGVGRQRDHAPEGEPREIRIANANDFQKEVDLIPKISHTESVKQRPSTQSRTKTMAEPVETPEAPKIDLVKERADAQTEYKANAKKIRGWVTEACRNNPGWRTALDAVAERHIEGAADFNAFLTEAVPAIPGAKSVDTPHDDASLGLSKKERRQFSLCKAYLEAASGRGLTGFEKDITEAAHKQYAGKDSREFQGLCIPDDIKRMNFAEDNDLGSAAMRELNFSVNRLAGQMQRTLNVSTFTAGGALVGTDLLAGSMIDILRNAVLIGNGPLAVTELGGLVGNVAIPKQTSTGTVYWLPEAGSTTASDVAFAQLYMTPHRMGARSSFTKQLLAQASIGVEAFVRQDQMLAMAVEEDRVTILGTGVNGEPLGIVNTTGVLANVTFGGAAVWGDFVNLEYGLENANIRTGQMAILTSPLTKSYLKQSTKIASSTFPIYIWEKNDAGFPAINGVMAGIINEYPAYATKNVTSNVVIQGVFSNVFKGRWAALDAVVDPYTSAATETINVYLNQWLDIGLRYPTSFNVSTDAPTAP